MCCTRTGPERPARASCPELPWWWLFPGAGSASTLLSITAYLQECRIARLPYLTVSSSEDPPSLNANLLALGSSAARASPIGCPRQLFQREETLPPRSSWRGAQRSQ